MASNNILCNLNDLVKSLLIKYGSFLSIFYDRKFLNPFIIQPAQFLL